MSPPSLYRRLAQASAGIAAFAAPLAPFAGPVAATGDDGSGAVVEDAGDFATAITLPPPPTTGLTASTATTIEVAIAAGASTIEFGVELHLTTGIDAVAEDGGYLTTTTFDEIELTSAENVNSAAFDALSGVAFRQSFDPDGAVTGVDLVDPDALTDQQRVAFGSISGNLQGAQTVYPDVPVGVGARWTAEQAVSGDSFPVTATYQYELTAIEDGRYTVAVSYASAFDTVVDGVSAVGTVSGLGSISGSIVNPLDVSYTLGQSTDSTAGGNAVNVVVRVTTTSTPG